MTRSRRWGGGLARVEKTRNVNWRGSAETKQQYIVFYTKVYLYWPRLSGTEMAGEKAIYLRDVYYNANWNPMTYDGRCLRLGRWPRFWRHRRCWRLSRRVGKVYYIHNNINNNNNNNTRIYTGWVRWLQCVFAREKEIPRRTHDRRVRL